MNQPGRRQSSFEDVPAIEELVIKGAWVAYSVSGGKDSSAAIAATMPLLDQAGHPREKRFLLHADLGRSEWKSTHPHVEELARHFDLPLHIVRHTTHDMVSRWNRRGELGRERWARGETVNLIGPWSSASLRWCTSEMKIHVMSRHKKSLDEPVISVLGIRRDESRGRAATPFCSVDTGMKRYKRDDCLSWNPIADWSSQDVFRIHEDQDIPLHEAYGMGSTRLSCNFCVLASMNDLSIAALQEQNLETYLTLVGMEVQYGFSFQPARWLADVRPQALPQEMHKEIEKAKRQAETRRALEASYPDAYRRRKMDELSMQDWNEIVRIRTEMSSIVGITDYIADPRDAAKLG